MEQEENNSKCRTFLGFKACHLAPYNYVVSRDVLPHFFQCIASSKCLGRSYFQTWHLQASLSAFPMTTLRLLSSRHCHVRKVWHALFHVQDVPICTRCTNFEDVMHAKLDRVWLIIGHAGSPNGRLSLSANTSAVEETPSIWSMVKTPVINEWFDLFLVYWVVYQQNEPFTSL